jgi:hypothetical protein
MLITSREKNQEKKQISADPQIAFNWLIGRKALDHMKSIVG